MNYIKIDTCNMNNGDGLRCVVWLSGCNHHCKNCFNPETWDENYGDEFGEIQQNIIYETLQQDWCSGITFTGGDPLFPKNIEQLLQLCKNIKKKFPKKTIWVYTGYSYDDVSLLDGFNNIDVLVDGEFVEELKSPLAKWVGSYNQRVIDVKKSLKSGKITLY